MSYYIPIETPGGIVWAEVDQAIATEGLSLTSIQEDVLKSFEETTYALKQNAQFVVKAIKDLEPSEVEVSFSIKVGVEGGVPFFALAKASGEGNYTIKLKWQSVENGSG